MIQRDDMGWEVGAGFRIGNSCTPMADSCQCMAKQIQYCKVKYSKNKNLKKEKKKKRVGEFNPKNKNQQRNPPDVAKNSRI